jgi:hypothetical protein
MDGSTASICIDGKQVAKQGFALRPSMVFIPDRPEGNFIACSRNQDELFKGRMDHFRIYREVHDDFESLGPAPFALTQMQEWSEEDQQRADEWEGRRKAKEAELKAGKYGQIQDEIKRLNEQKAALLNEKNRIERTAGGEGAKLDTRIEKLQQEARTLWDSELRSALVFGQNPYTSRDAARLKDVQENLKWHTAADWDYRTREEVNGKVTPKMKEWLLRVRGY